VTAVLALSAVTPLAVAARTAGASDIAGTWSMKQKGTCCTTSLTYTITRTGRSYTFANGAGQTTSGVTVAGPGSSVRATTYWCGKSNAACARDTGYGGTFEVKYVFDLATCPATVRYSWTQPFAKSNPYVGTGKGTRPCADKAH
jgi:hypothetical protein